MKKRLALLVILIVLCLGLQLAEAVRMAPDDPTSCAIVCPPDDGAIPCTCPYDGSGNLIDCDLWRSGGPGGPCN
jgi:hypothetical protein